ncbi:MAG: zf-HC2 domain-containing protein [Acidobacteriota bacterium]|nr:zf-HC2 domain-containing protein [Acidobacteriota bacterium]
MSAPIHCAEFDALLCDFLDGTLDGPSNEKRRAEFETHLAECSACGELARDAAEAMAFMERAADVEPPARLVTRILYQVPRGRTDGFRGWLNRLLEPVRQPRYVMGAMLTIVSMAMMTRCAGAPDHPLNASDLDPVKLWTALDNRVHRVWDRSLKTYESMRLVYEVQSRLRDWQDQQDDEAAVSTETPGQSRKLPMKAQPQPGH